MGRGERKNQDSKISPNRLLYGPRPQREVLPQPIDIKPSGNNGSVLTINNYAQQIWPTLARKSLHQNGIDYIYCYSQLGQFQYFTEPYSEALSDGDRDGFWDLFREVEQQIGESGLLCINTDINSQDPIHYWEQREDFDAGRPADGSFIVS